MGKLGREITNSTAFQFLRQGGDNLGRKARIVASSIEDRKIKTVVDDEAPTLLFRFDGEGWERWSVAWGRFEAAEPPPPLRGHLEAEGITPVTGDRFTVEDGAWRRADDA